MVPSAEMAGKTIKAVVVGQTGFLHRFQATQVNFEIMRWQNLHIGKVFTIGCRIWRPVGALFRGDLFLSLPS